MSTYEAAGVSIEAGELAVEFMKSSIAIETAYGRFSLSFFIKNI